MECQVEKLEHFRHILLFEFNRGAKVPGVARNICAVYGDNTIRESTARTWFSRFKEDHFDISDSPLSGRPSGFDEDHLNTLIHNDPHQCTRGKMMNCDHSNIVRHLYSMGKVKKIGCMGTTCSKPKPQKSAGDHMCISACSSAINSLTASTIPILNHYWWRQMVTLCNNIRKIKLWLSPNKRRICRKCSNFSTWQSIF